MYQCVTKCNSVIHARTKTRLCLQKSSSHYRYRNRDRSRLFKQLSISIAIWKLHQRKDALNISPESAALGPDFVHKLGRNFGDTFFLGLFYNTGYNGFKKNLGYLHNLHTGLILPDDIRVVVRTGILDS